MKLSDTKIDSAKVEQGDWVGDIPDFGDIRLKVRGLGNADYNRLQAKLIRSLPKAQRDGAVDKILPRLLADTILLDWDNVDEGPYSKDLAEKFLTDPDYRPFRDAVMWAASQVAERRADDLEADVKN